MSIKSFVQAAFQQPKNPLDDYRPAVARPQTSEDWKQNCELLEVWVTSIFDNVVTIDDLNRARSEPPKAGSSEDLMRLFLDIVLVMIKQTLQELRIVLELYGSASRLSPHIAILWPVVRTHILLRYDSAHDLRAVSELGQLVSRWRTEARASITEVLSAEEEGEALLQTFDWKKDPPDMVQTSERDWAAFRKRHSCS